MKVYFVDENCVLDLSQIVTYDYEEDVLQKNITVTLANGITVRANDQAEHSKKLFETLMKWHDNLLEESVDGIVSHST